MYKPALIAGSFLAALAVILGAFGAHALAMILPDKQLAIFDVGVRYQFYHSLALLITGITYQALPLKSLRLAATFFIIGIILFSGSLYAMTLLSTTGFSLGPVGIVTPIGGLFFIVGWIFYLTGIIRNK